MTLSEKKQAGGGYGGGVLYDAGAASLCCVLGPFWAAEVLLFRAAYLMHSARCMPRTCCVEPVTS